MAFAARIERDSISPAGVRLTTFVVTYPMIIHNELMTHRMLSRSSASSRAIPVERMIQDVLDDPFVPIYWGAAQKGMAAAGEVDAEKRAYAWSEWIAARDAAIHHVRGLLSLGLHKQVPNRLLQPWLWNTVVVSATEWQNFFGLRCHEAAEPHMRRIAEMMADLYVAETPTLVPTGGWHLPFIQEEDTEKAEDLGASSDFAGQMLAKISAARCARVSYLTHDGKRDLAADLALYERLAGSAPKHMSPLEHVACVPPGPWQKDYFGNLLGWKQLRKFHNDEALAPFDFAAWKERIR